MIRPADVPPSDPAPAGAPAEGGTRGRTPARSGASVWIGPLIAVDLALLIAAWFLPLMTLKSGCMLWDSMCVSREQVSLAGTVHMLASGREFLLLAVVGGFAMLFPVLKLIVAGWVWARIDTSAGRNGSRRRSRAFGWMHALGKWSMIDVFVVALIVVGVKASLIADVEVHSGIYVFTAAVALSILVMGWIERRLAPRRGSHDA